MEYAIFPLRHTWQSQDVNGSFSHKGTYAMDFGVLTNNKDTKLYAPFTGKIVYKGTRANGNGIVLESINKVIFADGTIDFACVVSWHDDDISDLKIGQIIKQNTKYADMGKANATATHCHLEVIKGKYKGWSGTTSQGSLKFINAIEPYKVLFLTKDTLLKYSNHTWETLPDTPIITSTVPRNENVSQIKVNIDNLNVRVEHSINSQSLGFVQNQGIYNDLEVYKDKTYTWHRIADNQWIADNGSWLELLPVINYKDMYEKEVKTNETLKEEINSLKLKLKDINKISTI